MNAWIQRRNWAGLLLLIAGSAGAWWSLGLMDDEVSWLEVSAPSHAVPGGILPLRVRVIGLKETSQLAVDLHGAETRDGSHFFVASGGAKLVGKEGGRFDFEIQVVPRQNLHFVNAVLFLSPSGSWKDKTFAATTESIPVRDQHRVSDSGFERLSVQSLGENGKPATTKDEAIPRLIVGWVLLVAALWVLGNSKPILNRWLGLAFALAGVWELLGLEDRLGEVARAWARSADVYYTRGLFQKALISLTIASGIVLAGLIWKRRGLQNPAPLFFGFYLGITAVSGLSLHSLDLYGSCSWLGISLVEGLKFACAAAILLSVIRARRVHNQPGSI